MKFMFILALIGMPVLVNAQTGPTSESINQEFTLTLQHTTLVVSDFERSETFYVDILGLKKIPASWLPENQAFLQLGPNLELHMGEVPGVEIKPSTFNHFAISVDDLDAFLKYLSANGIVYGSLGGGDPGKVQNRPDGVRQTFFQDPDGYWLEVNDYSRK